MPGSNQRQGTWAESESGPVRFPKHWHVLPHELVFALFLGATFFRLWAEVGLTHTSTLLYGLFLGALIWLVTWVQYHPSRARWRVRLLGCLTVSALSYFCLAEAVPAMYSPAGLESTAWHKDAALQQWDTAIFGDTPRQLMLAQPGAWVSDLMMICYFFFFYYIVGGLLYYLLKDLNIFRICHVGFRTLYALGYVGNTLMPTTVQLADLGPRTGGWITEVGGGFIAQRTNGVDVFPSIHMAGSLFLLVFDFWHRRTHFWVALMPTIGLWISTVYLRYHYGVDLIAGIVLAISCLWMVRWYAQSRLCAEVEAECAACSDGKVTESTV